MPDNTPIYVSDMDGTLLRDDGKLSEYAARELTRLLDAGVNFTVASARSVPAIRQALGDLPLRLPVIAINGAFISDFHTSEHIVINDMPTDTAADIYSRIRKHDCMPFMSAFDGRQDRLYYSRLINDGMKWYHHDRKTARDYRLTETRSITENLDRRIVAFTVINHRHKLLPLAEEIESQLGHLLENHFFENPYSPGWWWLTIHDKKACKSIAVKTLVEYAGFDLKDLVVFGDNLNDEKLFASAAWSVAVENATDQIKSHADEVIGPNSRDSVVDYISRRVTA